jgi:serine/threonine protein kinase
MHAPNALLKFVAKAMLNAVGGGVVADLVLDVLPAVARDVWEWWGRGRTPEQQRDELQALAGASPPAVRQAVAEVIAEVAPNRPPGDRLADYLGQVPAAVRQSLRRPSDPSGKTVPPNFTFGRPEDLLQFLPGRLPRFKPGDRPAGIGDWELMELLGVGGFGEVWKARNPHFGGPPVALKFCLDKTAAAALRNEVALLGRVLHAGKIRGIVQLLHTYLSADPPCLEYEYVAGGDLAGLMQQSRKPFPPHEAAKVILHLAQAAGHAHRLSPPIVHRDLKPANVLVERGADGKVSLKVADFGIGGIVAGQAIHQTRQTTRGAQLATSLRGAYTPLYASPEQVQGKPPDTRDDVHALGVIWYQLLTGDLGMMSVPTDWTEEVRGAGLNEDFIKLLASCIASRAERRPTDAAVVADRLTELLAPPPPPTDRGVPPPLRLTPPPAPVATTSKHAEGDGNAAPGRQYWAIAPYDSENPAKWQEVWAFDLANNIISIGWARVGDVSKMDEMTLRAAIKDAYPEKSVGMTFRMLWDFYHSIKKGDIVIARRGLKKIAAIGTVVRQAYYDPRRNPTAVSKSSGLTYPNHLDVRWHDSPRDETFNEAVFQRRTVQRISEEKVRELIGPVR